MPNPSSATMVQIVRVAGRRSMRAEIVPALKPPGPLTFTFPRLMSPAPAAPMASQDTRMRSPVKYGRPATGASSLFQRHAVDAPRAPAGKDEVQEDEAVEDGQFSSICERIDRARRVRHEIGEGHFAG